MIAYGFLPQRRMKILPLAGTMVRNSGNDRLGALEKEVLSTSVFCVSQVRLVSRWCYIYLPKPVGRSHVG